MYDTSLSFSNFLEAAIVILPILPSTLISSLLPFLALQALCKTFTALPWPAFTKNKK